MFAKKTKKDEGLSGSMHTSFRDIHYPAYSTCLPPVIYEIKLKTNRIYTCDHCFANGVAGPNGECEYCGSPLPISEK